MSNILILDTSTKRSVLAVRTKTDFLEETTDRTNDHSRDILDRINKLVFASGIRLSDLDTIIFGSGPGSYTGIRITVGVVQGLGFGLNIPVVPVSSLAAMAQEMISARVKTMKEGSKIFVGLKARQQEIWFGSYEWRNEMLSTLFPEEAIDVKNLYALPDGEWFGIGTAFEFHEQIELLTGVKFVSFFPDEFISAKALLEIGKPKFEAGETIESYKAIPNYLKDVVIG